MKDKKDIGTYDYKTNHFVCNYLYRPPIKDEDYGDMLKMCIYYGKGIHHII